MKKDNPAGLHFSRAAPIYHERAVIQRRVAARLLDYLSTPAEAGQILELGCGTGFLTEKLLETFPRARIDAVDFSAAMIEQARRTIADRGRVQWHVCDVWNYRAPSPYDLIGSSSSFQWMQPLGSLFRRIAPLLKRGGRLLGSLMVDGTLEELHRLRREIAPHKIPPERLPKMAQTLVDLQGAGFVISRSGRETLHTEHSSIHDLLRSIRELGFTGGPLSTSSTLLTRSELKQLAERYRVEFGLPGGRVAAQYVVGYFEAVLE
ncbi:MAG: methyltransferase [Thermoguttaceae bacterium]